MENHERKKDQKVFLIAQELELIRMLSGNEQKSKNKALKSLSKWLLQRTSTIPFTEEDFQRIWKGLYYCMWMSDKPLLQEECADKISKLVHFPDVPTALLFFKAGLYILSHEWSGIQQLRLDKFLMLIRRFLRETLYVLKNNKFSKSSIQGFNDVLSETVLIKTTPVGMFMHFVEIFLEELAKVSNGKLPPSLVLEFLMPFIKCLATSSDGRQIGHLRKFIFTYLIRQSKLGLEYQEKYEAWRQQGFPGSIDSMQKIKIDQNDLGDSDEGHISGKIIDRKEKPLDPRAGRVDVEIPQLHFKAQEIAKALLENKFVANSTKHSRAMIKTLADQFEKLGNGVYPLGIKKIEVKDKSEDIRIRKAANRLIQFDQKIMGKKNKKKRSLDKENNDDVIEKKRQKIDNHNNELDSNNKKTKKLKKKVETNEKDSMKNDDSSKEKRIKNKNKLNQIKEVQSEQNPKTLTILNVNIDKKNKKLKPLKTYEEDKSNSDNIKTKKMLTATDETKVKSNIIKAKNKVKGKIVQLKTTDKKIKKNKERKILNENVECIFERNSGTWVVYEMESSMKIEKLPKSPTSSENVVPAKSSKKQNQSDFEECKILGKEPSPNQSAQNKFLESPVSPNDSPKLGMVPVKLFESPPHEKEIFQKAAWDEPLQEGEYEICIPSKRHINKLKKQAKNQNKTVHELINMTLQKIKGKSRLSLDSRLVKDPFSNSSSIKKVKINTKLNKSQDVREHYISIKSSPGIPFDANRKPTKPLLKPTAVSTPINPFYKKQLHT